MATPWQTSLPWLKKRHATTAAELAALNTYFEQNAQELEKKSAEGWLPLHCAAAYQLGPHGLAVLKALLQGFPLAVKEETVSGDRALHLAAARQRGQHGLEMVCALLTADPTGARQQNGAGWLPLHFAAENKAEHAKHMVAALFMRYPAAARQRTDDGSLPLHYALRCQEGDSGFQLVTALCATYVAAAKVADSNDTFALHIAAQYQTGKHGVALVNVLLSAYKTAAKQKDNRQRLAMHLAAQHQEREHGVAVVNALLTAFRHAVAHKDDNGSRPLHVAARYQTGEHGLAVINALHTAAPWCAQQVDNDECLPLHIAARYQQGYLHVVTTLLTEYEAGAQKQDASGFLPLHTVVRFQQGEIASTLVNALLLAYREGARCLDKKKRTPLHIAIYNQRGALGAVVIKALLEAYPEGAQALTSDECLPLHITASYQQGEHVPSLVRALLAVFPEAAKHVDKSGWLPLHFAAHYQKTLSGADVVKLLLLANPTSAAHKARNGWTALHAAAASQDRTHGLALINALLDAYPLAAQECDDLGRLPLHYAARNLCGQQGLAVLEALFAAYPHAVQHVDHQGLLPLHLGAKIQAGDHAEAVLKALLTAYPRSVQQTTYNLALPLHFAQQENSAEHKVVELLQAATDGTWQPDPLLDKFEHSTDKITAAYLTVTAELDLLQRRAASATLTVEQYDFFVRLAYVQPAQLHGGSAKYLTALAAAASGTAAKEKHFSTCAGTLLHAGAFLHELLIRTQQPIEPLPAVKHLQTLCAAAEDAVAALRNCHSALMAQAAADPPLAGVDPGLVAARNAALLAFQAASSAFSEALVLMDADAISAASKLSTAEVDALLSRITAETGGVHKRLCTNAASCAAAVLAGDATSTIDDPSPALQAAVRQLDASVSEVAKALSPMACTRLLSVQFTSLSGGQPIAERTLDDVQNIKHALLSRTNRTSLCHFLTYDAPWQLVYAALAARAMLQIKANAITALAPIASQLDSEAGTWTTAFHERDTKVAALVSTQRALSDARRKFRHAQADADTNYLDEEHENEPKADRVSITRKLHIKACAARDEAANDLLATALAYYPETLLLHRRELIPKGLLSSVVSQRSLDDYNDIATLEGTAGGRHTLLSATFAGARCVLKVVPIAGGSTLAREASILLQLKHPGIVELIAVFVETPMVYLHMAHASHGDLERFLTAETAALTKGTPLLPPRQLQRMARQLCEAVAYLVERSVVHCDIKPTNVFVDGERSDDSLHVVLGDFDVSHTATGRTTTLTRSVAGAATHYTPGFAAPEVLHAPAGQSARVAPAIDVYGLGCVIFAMHMFPRTLPEPADVHDIVVDNAALFASAALPGAASPAMPAWAASVPQEVVRAATRADPRARASARELLYMRYMLDASGAFAHASVQRPAYWLHQSHTGSRLVDESAEVRAAVETLFNATAEPASHGTGRDSHRGSFQHFAVTRVQRLEHPAVWFSYAGQRRHLADTLAAEGYTPQAGIRPLATEGEFVYPLEGGSLESAAGEVFLFHGTSKPASIASTGFDVRYAFTNAGAGAAFGRGVYFGESVSKADQYVVANGTAPLTMVVARVLLGRTATTTALRQDKPFLPEVEDKTTPDVPVYYDSLVADMRPGLRFREIIIGEGSRAYPELFVEYKRE